MRFAVAARRVHLIALCAVLTALNCCDEKKDPVRPVDDKLSGLQASFRHALSRSRGDEAELAATEFQKLLDAWQPIGKTASSLKEVVGEPEPGWEDSASIIHHFDTGWVALEFVFLIESGTVTKLEVR